jgi:hypothetical protein
MHNTKRCPDFDTYLAAHQRAYVWAERALRFRSAGKFAQAEKAVERVNLGSTVSRRGLRYLVRCTDRSTSTRK